MRRSENPIFVLMRKENPLFEKPLPKFRDYAEMIIKMLIVISIFELGLYLVELSREIWELYEYDYETRKRVLSGRMMEPFWEIVEEQEAFILLLFWAAIGIFSLIPLIRFAMHISEKSIYTILRIPEKHERFPMLRTELTKRLLLPAICANLIISLAQGILFLLMGGLYYLIVPNQATPAGQTSVFVIFMPGLLIAVAALCVWIPSMLFAMVMFRSRNRRMIWVLPVLAAYVLPALCAENELDIAAFAGAFVLAAVITVVSVIMYLSKGLE